MRHSHRWASRKERTKRLPFLLKCLSGKVLVLSLKFLSSWAQTSKISIRELYTGGYLSVKHSDMPQVIQRLFRTRLCHVWGQARAADAMVCPLRAATIPIALKALHPQCPVSCHLQEQQANERAEREFWSPLEKQLNGIHCALGERG